MNEHSNEPIQSGEPQQTAGVEAKPGWFSRKEYSDPAEKRRDFWIGVGLWWGLNILLSICQYGLAFGLFAVSPDSISSDWLSSPLFSILSWLLTLLPWIINIGLIIYFAFTRSQIALGMLAGFGIALAIVICLGVIFTVWCMVSLGSY